MDAYFTVRADPQVNFLDMTMGGFFTTTDVAAFADAVRRELSKLRCGSDQHVTLCDVTAMQIQSQDVVEAFHAMLAHPRLRSRKLAYVLDTTLARMQIRRLTGRPSADFFATRAEAEAWLFDR